MINKKIIIIGKRSNLSQVLFKKLNNSLLISTQEFQKLEDQLKKNERVDLIYNSSVKSSLLDDINLSPLSYINYSIYYLSKYIEIFRKYDYKINSLIYTSSCSIYGNNKYAKEEDHKETRNLYSSLKLSSEYLIEKYLKQTTINLIYPRIFNMYGGKDNYSIISKLIESVLNEKPFTLLNNGEFIRDFINIKDVAIIYKILLEKNFQGPINISTGKGISIKNIIHMIEKIINKTLFISNRYSNSIRICVGCNDKLVNEVGYKNFVELEDFLKQKLR